MAKKPPVCAEWLKPYKPEKQEAPKPIPMAKSKFCKKHKTTMWGGIPCVKCISSAKTFKERHCEELDYMEYASKFCEKTGAILRGFDPGFSFVLYKNANWPETIELSNLAVKRIAEAMK